MRDVSCDVQFVCDASVCLCDVFCDLCVMLVCAYVMYVVHMLCCSHVELVGVCL